MDENDMSMSLFYAPLTLATPWAAGPGEAEFPRYPASLRQAIYLCRHMQSPVASTASLFDTANTICSVRLHPLQGDVPKSMLLKSYTQMMRQVVAYSGVDVLEAAAHRHFSNHLQFVPGLGPRLAHSLLDRMFRNPNELNARTDFVSTGYMGKCIFINASAFLHFGYFNHLEDMLVDADPLDTTRIHPESYETAINICRNALGGEDNEDSAEATMKVIQNPDPLEDLDLEAYAKMLCEQGQGEVHERMSQIKRELTHPFAPNTEKLPKFSAPAQDQVFAELVGETASSFCPGTPVTAVVTRIIENGVHCRLDNGLHGFIRIADLSDNHVESAEDVVNSGMTVHARVKDVDVEKLSLTLTTRAQDLKEESWFSSFKRDEYFEWSKERDLIAHYRRKHESESGQQCIAPRNIDHPVFFNVSGNEAEERLAEMPQGEAIIRPSKEGADHLTITWKVADNRYHHIDVKEEDKSVEVTVGRTLLVGGRQFHSLDDVLANYVQPLADFTNTMLTHKYFVNGTKDDTMKELDNAKRQYPKHCAYRVCLAENCSYPRFLLSYRPNVSTRKELIVVETGGFRYRDKLHKSPDRLFSYFKQHFNDAVHQPRQPQRALQSFMGNGEL